MVFAPAPGVAQVDQIFATNGGRAENVYHVKKESGAAWTLPELVSLGDLVHDWEQATGRVQRSSSVVCIETRVRDLTTSTALEYATSGNDAGSIASGSAPDNVTIAIKKNTGHVGRGFRGRTFWIGVPDSKVIGDNLEGTYVSNVAIALNTLLVNVNSVAGFYLTLLRSRAAGVALNPRLDQQILSFSTVDTVIDSQRRRLPGRGR